MPSLPGRAHVARTDLGYVQMKSRLPEIMVKLSTYTGMTNREIAGAIAEGAKERVPVETGKLRNAIHVEYKGGERTGGGLETAQLGTDDWAVIAGDNEAFYGHFVEYGHHSAAGEVPAHPFLTPAAEAVVPSIWARYAAKLKNL